MKWNTQYISVAAATIRAFVAGRQESTLAQTRSILRLIPAC